MITVAIFNIIVVLFAYLARYKGYEFFLKVSFFIIFLFLALRYDYGNDYQNYLYTFLDAKHSKEIDFNGTYSGPTYEFKFESGWLILYWLFQYFGFFSLVAILAAFNCFVYFRFIKKYVPPRYYWFAVFLYVFYPFYMLINISAMRQSLAICIFILSIDFLYKKDIFRYFLCILLASFIHISVLILFPIYLLVLFEWRINKFLAICIFIMYIIIYQSNQYLTPILNTIVFNNTERLGEITQVELGTGLGILYFSVLMIIILFYEQYQNKETSLLFKISILGFFVKPFIQYSIMFGRISFYFDPILICVLPIIIISIKNNIVKNTCLFSIILVTLYLFQQFFQDEIWNKSFSNYQTIFNSNYFY